MKVFSSIAVFGACSFFGFTASAQLFRDQMNNGAAWGVNSSGSDYLATFNYDYSANGIPEAPHSLGADIATRGLKMEANLVTPADVQFFTAYPLGQNFSGSYQLRFDAWMNYSSSATTEFMGGGIGYDNVTADVASGAQAIVTGDGGSTDDWRALKDGFYVPPGDMAAGTRSNADPYYANFLPSVNGSIAGAPGKQWITWEFNVEGNEVSIFIEKPNGDRLELISYNKTDTSDGSSGIATDGNISLFYADFFTSVAPADGLTFGLVDNVIVTPVPEPSTIALGLMGGLAFLGAAARRRFKK